MLREKAKSKYAEDPRVDWVNDVRFGEDGGVIYVRIAAADVPSEPPEPRSDFLWGFEIFGDEQVEIGLPNDYQLQYTIYLVSGGRRENLTGGGYTSLDRALELVLGPPR